MQWKSVVDSSFIELICHETITQKAKQQKTKSTKQLLQNNISLPTYISLKHKTFPYLCSS